MKTSYFAQLRKVYDKGFEPISIALYQPSFYKGLSMPILAPTKEILKLKASPELYSEAFNEYLSKLNAKSIVDEIHFLSDDKEPCLLCYEKPDDFCHRHLVSKWLTENGYNCEEFIFEKIVKKSRKLLCL